MPNLDTPTAILAVIVLAFLAGFGWSIGAWLWGKLCTRFGW
jgi:hypothetical protein